MLDYIHLNLKERTDYNCITVEHNIGNPSLCFNQIFSMQSYLILKLCFFHNSPCTHVLLCTCTPDNILRHQYSWDKLGLFICNYFSYSSLFFFIPKNANVCSFSFQKAISGNSSDFPQKRPLFTLTILEANEIFG